LRIVAGHIGAPWTAEMISLATKFENVYIDTSAYKVSRFPPEFRSYLQSHGRAKIMFGSNYPMLTPSACLADLDSLALEEATRADYLGQTASRVFRLD
jgi:predicted TIM-barrel fold metal-dependent hydrolase